MSSASTDTPVKVAFVDLLFCWPPNGGADVDLYNVAAGLSARGIDIRVFVLHLEGSAGRGQVLDGELPFPLEVVPISSGNRHHKRMAAAMKNAVDDWHPDLIFMTHGYALKPYMILALTEYPVISRYYAHELFCARDGFRYKEGTPCPSSIVTTPDICQKCAFESLAPEIKSGKWRAWAEDYIAAEAYGAGYYKIVEQAMESVCRIVVSNQELKEEMGRYKAKTVVVPGGASLKGGDIVFCKDNKEKAKKQIFMPGRVEDPLKGLQVLMDAATLLDAKRSDFKIVITHFDTRYKEKHISSAGWLTYQQTLDYYQQSDICVVPSLWREPFGLVAVEAMVAGLPVCASNTGGLRDIVVHGETGFLFPPGDAGALAECLERLLSDAQLRENMGRAGYQRAMAHYSWDAVIDQHYMPLIATVHEEKNRQKGITP